jgi:hypothetical protein
MTAMFGDVDLWLPHRIRLFFAGLKLKIQKMIAKISTTRSLT